MTDPAERRLQALEERIEAAKAKQGAERPHMEEHYSRAQLAWRMVIELVAGVVIGFGIGYSLDWALGTEPWLMIIFIGFGFIAGVKTVIRSAEEAQKKLIEREAGDRSVENTGDSGLKGEGNQNGF